VRWKIEEISREILINPKAVACSAVVGAAGALYYHSWCGRWWWV
jgi:hypothetical protein